MVHYMSRLRKRKQNRMTKTRKAFEPLQWSETLPTVPGAYWLRTALGGNAALVLVRLACVEYFGTTETNKLDAKTFPGCSWLGPLTVPEGDA